MLDTRIYVLLNGNVKVDFDDIVAMHYNNVLGTGNQMFFTKLIIILLRGIGNLYFYNCLGNDVSCFF